MNTCIVLPAHNEELAIGGVIDEIRNTVSNVDILVVDNNSTDKTATIARNKGIRVIFEPKTGKGNAFRAGIANTKADLIIMMDADFTYPAYYIPEIQVMLKHYPIVIGSRLRGWCQPGSITRLNTFGNRGLCLLASILYGTKISDMCTGYWGFRRNILHSMNLKIEDFLLEAELFSEAALHKYPIAEIPIHYCRRKGVTKLSNSVHVGWDIAVYLCRKRVRTWGFKRLRFGRSSSQQDPSQTVESETFDQ